MNEQMRMKLHDYDSLEWFGAHEFNAPMRMGVEFLRRLNTARGFAGIPFKITSSFRENSDTAHGLGLAVDIALPKDGKCRERWRIRASAERAGITRIGIYDRHIHLDCGDLFDPVRFPPNCLFWGKSK